MAKETFMTIRPADVKLLALGVLVMLSCSSAATQVPDAAPTDCYPRPMSHLEIINSCADVTTYAKLPQLPKFAAGAALMPLP